MFDAGLLPVLPAPPNSPPLAGAVLLVAPPNIPPLAGADVAGVVEAAPPPKRPPVAGVVEVFPPKRPGPDEVGVPEEMAGVDPPPNSPPAGLAAALFC